MKRTFSPCKSVKSFITALWNRHLPKWRRRCPWISDSHLSPTLPSLSSFFTRQQLLRGRPTRPGRLSHPPSSFFSQLCPQYQRFPVQDANLRTVKGRKSQRKFVTKDLILKLSQKPLDKTVNWWWLLYIFIADICPNHTTSGGPGVLFSIERNVCPFWPI